MSTAKAHPQQKVTFGTILTSLENKLSFAQKLFISIAFIVTTVLTGYKIYYNQNVSSQNAINTTQMVLTTLKDIKRDVQFIAAVQENQLRNDNTYWWRSDSTGGTIAVGGALCKLLDKNEKDLLQAKWMENIPYEEIKGIQEEFDAAKKYKRDFNYEYHYKVNDTTIIKVHAKAHYAGQDWLGIITVLEDPRNGSK